MPDATRPRGTRKRPTRLIDWRVVEALGHAHFMNQGWRVLVAPYDTACFDFVAEKDGLFVRVNVKVASPHQASYVITRAGGSKHHKVNPDLYLAWIPDRKAFVEVPGPHLKGKSARITQRFVAQQLGSTTQ